MTLFRKKLTDKTDEELMLLLMKGEQQAFDELYQRYAKQMLNFFFRMLNNDREKAEDYLHDLFLKVILNPEKFDQNRNFRIWFYTLAGNMIKNEYRKGETRSEYETYVLHSIPENVNQCIEQMDKEQFENRLQKELEKMDSNTKMIFDYRFIQEMSIKEIADIMNCPEGTVKSRLFHLTKLLSKKLKQFKPELN